MNILIVECNVLRKIFTALSGMQNYIEENAVESTNVMAQSD